MKRTVVIIKKRGQGYISTVYGKYGGGHSGVRCGLRDIDAAISATELMLKYAVDNPLGGDLVAPIEVLKHVPEHLRSINNED